MFLQTKQTNEHLSLSAAVKPPEERRSGVRATWSDYVIVSNYDNPCLLFVVLYHRYQGVTSAAAIIGALGSSKKIEWMPSRHTGLSHLHSHVATFAHPLTLPIIMAGALACVFHLQTVWTCLVKVDLGGWNSFMFCKKPYNPVREQVWGCGRRPPPLDINVLWKK